MTDTATPPTTEFELDLSDFTTDVEALGDPEFIIWYGPYGGGKTHLALSASEVPGLYPMLVIDTEGSTVGVIENFDKSRIDVIRPNERWPANPWRATVKIINDLLDKTHKYKTVVIDAADVMFDWGLRELNVPGDGFAKWTAIHETLTESNKDKGKGLFHKLKAAPFLVILVVHEKADGGDGDGLTKADFMWQGQGKGKLGGIPDMVGYVVRDTDASGKSKTTVHTAPTKRNNAKNRFGLPAKLTDNPTMSTIYSMIRNRKEQ
jgi:hypothetical protein